MENRMEDKKHTGIRWWFLMVRVLNFCTCQLPFHGMHEDSIRLQSLHLVRWAFYPLIQEQLGHAWDNLRECPWVYLEVHCTYNLLSNCS